MWTSANLGRNYDVNIKQTTHAIYVVFYHDSTYFQNFLVFVTWNTFVKWNLSYIKQIEGTCLTDQGVEDVLGAAEYSEKTMALSDSSHSPQASFMF
jgi:hypothetical protein